VPGADKLYKLIVDIGEERTIVAGIKLYYTKEELIGKRIVIIANLEPKRLRGITSHGMLLAGIDRQHDKVILVTLDGDIKNGSKVS